MTTPYHKSERMFRRYEAKISTVLKNWPRVTLFDPSPHAIETFSCRLRDSIASWRDNHWPATFMDSEDVRKVLAEVVVSTTFHPGKIACGPRDELRRGLREVSNAGFLAEAPRVQGLRVETDKLDVVEAICILHHYRILTEPTIIKTPNSPLLTVADVAQKYDVFVDGGDGIWTIV